MLTLPTTCQWSAQPGITSSQAVLDAWGTTNGWVRIVGMGRFGSCHVFLFGFIRVTLDALRPSLVRGIEGDQVRKKERTI